MGVHRAVAAALGLVACAPVSAAPPAQHAAPAAVPVPVTAPEEGGVPPAPGPGACDAMHVWDPVAKACRLFPGGGNGWAGCSMAAAPPNGELCVTGTHWADCDCGCDRPGTTFDKQAATCR
jgi:hypothetical protein